MVDKIMKSMKILKTILVFTTLLITACQPNKAVETISESQISSVCIKDSSYTEESSKNDNILSTTDVPVNYVYCHFEDYISIEPIHVKAISYEEIAEETMYTVVLTYYRFTLENSEQTPTFRTEDCTLFYDTYCPVCQKEIDNYLN